MKQQDKTISEVWSFSGSFNWGQGVVSQGCSTCVRFLGITHPFYGVYTLLTIFVLSACGSSIELMISHLQCKYSKPLCFFKAICKKNISDKLFDCIYDSSCTLPFHCCCFDDQTNTSLSYLYTLDMSCTEDFNLVVALGISNGIVSRIMLVSYKVSLRIKLLGQRCLYQLSACWRFEFDHQHHYFYEHCQE